MNKEIVEIIQIKSPNSYSGTVILGKRYDLIFVDFELEHPVPELVCCARYCPGSLVFLTDRAAGQFLVDYVEEHLKVCEGECPDLVKEGFKSY